MRKARLILGIARRLRGAARHLAVLSQRSFIEGDRLRGARMHEATQRLIQAHDEIRAQAGTVLAQEAVPDSDPLGLQR